jgi:hypothetical protein
MMKDAGGHGSNPRGEQNAGIDAIGITNRLYHGSPKAGLSSISAGALRNRQFDNAGSRLGAFFAADTDEASHYGPNMYEADLGLKNPYEMSWNDFKHFQDISHDKAGKDIEPPQWKPRMEQLKKEAMGLRKDLEAKGHDGVIIRWRDGSARAIASFKDVPVRKSDKTGNPRAWKGS